LDLPDNTPITAFTPCLALSQFFLLLLFSSSAEDHSEGLLPTFVSELRERNGLSSTFEFGHQFTADPEANDLDNLHGLNVETTPITLYPAFLPPPASYIVF
jgi:hypothetical protein